MSIKLHHEVTAKLKLTVKALGQPEPEAAPAEEGGPKTEKTYKAKHKAKHN